jgi:hypothetical protein
MIRIRMKVMRKPIMKIMKRLIMKIMKRPIMKIMNQRKNKKAKKG